MGTEQVYKAKTVLLVANGARKTGPVTESILGDVTPDVPISYGQKYAAEGGNMIYVIDEAAAVDILAKEDEVKAKGYEIIDMCGEAYDKVETISFTRNPDTDLMG
jgi:glucosamine-6-phosphate deaminase